MDRLSKRDFERLGCADMPGPQLRARVFLLEGLVAELALSLREMVDRFAPDDDGLGDAEITVASRARECLSTVCERYRGDGCQTSANGRFRIRDWHNEIMNDALVLEHATRALEGDE